MNLPRIARTALAAALLAAGVSLLPATAAWAAVVNPAYGGSAISVDEFATSAYTTLTGPSIAESSAGEITAGSTTILSAPYGFLFNPTAGSVTVHGSACNLTGQLSVTTSHATFTATHASTISGCVVTFVGLEVQPTMSGSGLYSGTITKSGTSALPAGNTSYGTLTRVAGKPRSMSFASQPSPNNYGGSTFGTPPRVQLVDQFGNNVPGVPVTLSIAKGTGVSGAALTCDSKTVTTTANGADYNGDGCKIDRASTKTYKLKASGGGKSATTGAFTVNVGAASKFVFRSFPKSTTKTALKSQPSVAVTDAGGNTVTSYTSTDITLGINRHDDTFTCTHGLTASTHDGVATWYGCKQTTTGSHYQLTAMAGFATATTPFFKVKH